jgi:hypothetical protein
MTNNSMQIDNLQDEQSGKPDQHMKEQKNIPSKSYSFSTDLASY